MAVSTTHLCFYTSEMIFFPPGAASLCSSVSGSLLCVFGVCSLSMLVPNTGWRTGNFVVWFARFLSIQKRRCSG